MLDRRKYAIKERVGLFKLTDAYDIYDGESGDQLGIAREEISGLVKVVRLFVNKKLLPTVVNVYAGTEEKRGPLQFSIKRGVALLRPKVDIITPDGRTVGYLKSKLLSLGGCFMVFDPSDKQIAEIKGDWKGWNFKVSDNSGREVGVVAKKWAGLAKEMFTSADNYAIALNDGVEVQAGFITLLLAAGLAIDTVFKESNQ